MIGTEAIARKTAEGTALDHEIGAAQGPKTDGGQGTAALARGTGKTTGIEIEIHIAVMIGGMMMATNLIGRDPLVHTRNQQVVIGYILLFPIMV